MIKNPKIAISIPGADKSDLYFSFRLKKSVENEPSVYKHSNRIFVISDIEGNFQTFCKLLVRGKVINKYLQWTFSDNHLVILGDCFDRGEQVAECLWLIYSLEEKARRHGGYVHFILGNHEIMNLNGDWRYVHPKYAEETKSKRPQAALYGGNHELWHWLRTKNIIEKIGEYLFVHGGISEDILKLNLSVPEINKRVRPFYTKGNDSFRDPLLEIVFNSECSPFWFRGYYNSGMKEEVIDATLDQFGVKKIITGHTISEKIATYFNGKVINTDTDHSTENSEALLITRKGLYRIYTNDKAEKIVL
ncbi:hypothetical protein A4H97_09480 [Niastella yeongjuensis]|uniref:Calcineurin-like phosphoesterase domain-containing protein n=1 Tax=Niastella yeongjuensis TaxID=354355 RepID=A0A1V9EEN0_9BACT|nr:metallophosphoesterase [Niastella yeongjuensis]OQP44589.1 hypothetical protein A4H97_09480 [Niastella yeongjuensis]SEO82225.1 Calcineurin-like phosphoesterase [Niastella yeongjuensis]